MPKRYRQLWVKDLPKVPMWRLRGFEPVTLRTQGTKLTTEPPHPHVELLNVLTVQIVLAVTNQIVLVQNVPPGNFKCSEFSYSHCSNCLTSLVSLLFSSSSNRSCCSNYSICSNFSSCCCSTAGDKGPWTDWRETSWRVQELRDGEGSCETRGTGETGWSTACWGREEVPGYAAETQGSPKSPPPSMYGFGVIPWCGWWVHEL